MSAQVGDQVVVNVDPLASGGALTAPAVVCRVWPADPDGDREEEEVSVWVFADYAAAPVLRQNLVAAPNGVLPEPKKKDNGVRDLTVWAPLAAADVPPQDTPADPAPVSDPAPVPDPGTGDTGSGAL